MCCRKNKLEGELKFGKKLENIAFITALVIVIALFSLPIIFYYTSVSRLWMFLHAIYTCVSVPLMSF